MKNSKSLCCFLLLSFLVVLVAHQPVQAADDVTRVFIFAGQSNMVGSDSKDSLVDNHPPFKGAAEEQKDIRFSYSLGPSKKSNGWVAMKPVDHVFGPEMTFVRKLKEHVKYPIAIIKDAWGGTTLVNDWNPAGPEKGKKLYARLLKQVAARLKELDAKGIKYRIEAMMWHQGENDMFNKEGIATYEKNLRSFIAKIRKDLKSPKLNVFIGEISNKGVWGMDNRHRVAKICVQQLAVVKTDPNVHFVPTSHVGFKIGRPVGLHYHFGTLGQLQHGEENDRALHQQAKMYAPNLKKLIAGTRKDLSAPKLKWYITEQPVIPPDWAGKRKFLPVTADLQALAQADANISFIKTTHLPHRVVLFGTEGILTLGEEMARALGK